MLPPCYAKRYHPPIRRDIAHERPRWPAVQAPTARRISHQHSHGGTPEEGPVPRPDRLTSPRRPACRRSRNLRSPSTTTISGSASARPSSPPTAAGWPSSISRVDDEKRTAHPLDRFRFGRRRGPCDSRPAFSDGRPLARLLPSASPPPNASGCEDSRQPVKNNSLGLLNLQHRRAGEDRRGRVLFVLRQTASTWRFRRYKPEDKESRGVDMVVRDTRHRAPRSASATSPQLAVAGRGPSAGHDHRRRRPDRQRRQALRSRQAGACSQLDTDADDLPAACRWREESADLAVLKTYGDEEGREDTAHVALAWRNLDAAEDSRSLRARPA